MRRVVLGVLLGGVVLFGCSATRVPPREIIPAAPVPPANLHANFAEAVDLFTRQQYPEAAARFGWLLQGYPALEDYHLYYLGVASGRLAHTDAARATLHQLLAAHPRSVWIHRAALELGHVELHAGRLDAARDAYQTAATARDRPTKLAGELGRARADIAAGRLAAAGEELQALRREAPGEDAGKQARTELMQQRATHPELVPVGAARIDELQVLLGERDFAAAEPLARELLPESHADGRAELLHLHAEALLGLGRTDEGIATLRAAAAIEAGPVASATMFQIASTLWNRDRDEEALAAFEAYRRRDRRGAKANEALYAIGRIHERAGRAAPALAAYRELARVATRDPRAREARWRIGWIHYRRGDWTAAEQAFRILASRCDGSGCPDALYWQARALERAGRAAAAHAGYEQILASVPTSYYAMWAEERLGTAPGVGVTLTPAAQANGEQPTPGYHSDRAIELQQADLLALARVELAAHEREHQHDPAELRRLIAFYPSVDGHGAALRLARRLGSQANMPPSQYQRVMYPLGFWSLISSAAADVQVDPILVAALIRQESLYDPDARSPADAWGLMQLLPRTAERVAGAPVPIEALRDPERNIELGTRHLADLLAAFGGDPLKALAAYNGGEHAVAKWEHRFPSSERDEWVEAISYRETRDYVKKVIGGYREYVRLYGQ
jgi:soluble lytic murein transglycosylase